MIGGQTTLRGMMGDLRAAPNRQAVRLALGVVLTVIIVGLAAGLIWAIDGLPVVDPFERWLLAGLAAPFWLLAPVVAGFTWRPLPPRHAWLGSVLVGLGGVAIGGIAFWPWSGPALVCFGTVVDPSIIFMPGAVLVSAVFGGGLALVTLIAAKLARQGWRSRTLVACAILQIGFFVVVGVFSLEVAFGNICRMAPVPAQP